MNGKKIPNAPISNAPPQDKIRTMVGLYIFKLRTNNSIQFLITELGLSQPDGHRQLTDERDLIFSHFSQQHVGYASWNKGLIKANQT